MGDPAKRPYRTYRVVETGSTWDVPDESYEQWASDMRDQNLTVEPLGEESQPVDFPRVPEAGESSAPDDRPISTIEIGPVSVEPRFDDAGVDEPEQAPEANMIVGEPEIIKSPRFQGFDAIFSPEEANPQRPDYSFFEGAARDLEPLAQSLSSGTAEFGNSVDAFNRGFNTTALSGGSDELLGALNAMGDAELEDTLAQERAMNEYMGNEYPVATGLGKGAGLVPGMIARPASALGRIALGTLQGIATGGLSSDSNDTEQTLEDLGKGGLWGFGLGTGGELLQKLAPLLRRFGVSLRRSSAAPGTAEDLDAIAKQRGIDYMDTGIDERFDELGLASNPLPQSAATVAKRIGPERNMPGAPGMLQDAGHQIDSAIDTAQAVGARGNWQAIESDLGQQARDILSSVPKPGQHEFNKYRELVRVRNEIPGAMSPGPVPPATPRQLQAKKLAFQEAGKYPKGVGIAPEHQLAADASRKGRAAVANELDQTMQAAGPDVHAQFGRANRDYRDLAQFGEMAREQAARVKAAPANLLTYGSMSAGSGAGALASEALGLGPVPGAVLGGAGGFGVNALGKRYGKDVVGWGTMGAAHLADETGLLMQATAGRAMPEGAANPPNVTDVALSVRPEDMGGYANQFAEARNAPDPQSATSALILRLTQTDPDFRLYVLPMLRVGAVEQR